MSISRINNPDFAEKLMSTFYCGASMNAEEEQECKRIWEECNNVRFDVLKKVVEICGNINTPQSRYVKAMAWLFNSTMYSSQRIDAINDYLNNKLYYDSYKNNVVTLEEGRKKGEAFHRVTFLKYLADAYNSLKEYDKCEQVYLEIIKQKTLVPNGYIYLADFYRKRGNLEKAIKVLQEGKKSINSIFNKEYREQLNKKINEYEKLKVGERSHIFTCYDNYPSTWINGTYRRDIEQAHMKLRSQYASIFENHRTFINNIEHIEFDYKSREEDIIDNKDYETYLLSDINLYDKIMEFYNKINKLGFEYKYQYEDNGRNDYTSLKKLVNYYAKNNQFDNAIEICRYAIDRGITNFTPKKLTQIKLLSSKKRKNNIKACRSS